MKSDAQLKTDVSRELEWDPSINAAHIGVAVDDGVVSLTGHIDTYAEKFAIEHAVQRVSGVRALAVELDVKLAPSHQRSDTEIARAAELALTWHALVPTEAIQVKVEKGWVTLGGEVHWDYQRDAAVRAVRPLVGVVGVSNLITLKLQANASNISTRIREALERQAQREARNIDIKVNGSTVTLRGKVHSLVERTAVQGAAWSAPGVGTVINELLVDA